MERQCIILKTGTIHVTSSQDHTMCFTVIPILFSSYNFSLSTRHFPMEGIAIIIPSDYS